MRRCAELCGAVALLLAGMTALPVAARESGFAGRWCSENGEWMVIEAGNIGFNEHTMCDLPVALPQSGMLKAELACRNIYFNDGEAVEAFHRTLAVVAEIVPGGLRARMGDQEQPALWRRCDN